MEPKMAYIEIKEDESLYCTECKKQLGDILDQQLGLIPRRLIQEFKYCPFCGSKFKGFYDYEIGLRLPQKRSDNK